MTVEHIEILVEEPSLETALHLLLPKMIGGISFEVRVHQCKSDLLDKLPQRLQGYSKWIPETFRIVVVVDRDDDDCHVLKDRLEKMAEDEGLITRTKAGGGAYVVVNRIAIEELEAWYFGDWEAVRAAYPRTPENIPAKRRYRNPDGIAGGTWEAFERVLNDAGYFRGGLRKIEAASEIAVHMDPSRNTSRSFCHLRDVLLELAGT
jgi:hypothetical protein